MTNRQLAVFLFSLLIVVIVFVRQQAHAFSHVYSARTTLKSVAFSPDGLSIYFASKDNSIRKMEEKHHHHIQTVACDPMAYSGHSGDDGDAMLAGCTLSNKQGTLQVSNGKVYFVNGLSLRVVDEGIVKTLLEDDIKSMYVSELDDGIIYSSGEMIKKRYSNGKIHILAGVFECKGEQDGLSVEESCVHPSHITQDESMDGEIYFYDEKVKAIRKIHENVITTISGTSGYSIFDVRHGVIYCSNGRFIKRIQHDGSFQILGGHSNNLNESPDGTLHEFTNLQVEMLKISPEWGEDEVYFISTSGQLRKINHLGKVSTLISKSMSKPKFYRARTVLSEFETQPNNGTCFYCFDNSTSGNNTLSNNGTVSHTNGTVFGNNTHTNGTSFGNNTYVNGTFGNSTNLNDTINSNGTQPFEKKIDYYPTPILSSKVSQDGSGLRFELTFGKSNLYSHRLFYAQDSNYDTTLCKNTYQNRMIPMTLVDSSDAFLTQNYTTNYIPLSNLIYNPSVTKKFTSDYLQLTINLALEYVDDYGEFNGGFCRAYIYKTSQVINIFYTSTVISSFYSNHVLDFSYKIYPQLVTTDSYSGAGSLIVDLILETNNITIQQFNYHNSTNPNCDFVINTLEYQFSKGNFKYTKISMKTASKAYDFSGTSYFYARFESNRGFSFIDYIPLVVNYQIVIIPEEQNTTVKYSLNLSGNDLSPKSSFKVGDSLYVRLNAINNYGSYKLRAKSAYLCCMKEYSPAPIYDPSKNLYGCSSYNASSMDVWKALYTNFVPNPAMNILEIPNSQSFHIFFFNIKYEYFPIRKSYNAACYIQTTGGLQQNYRQIHSDSLPETVVQPLSISVSVNTPEPSAPQTPQPVKSQKVSGSNVVVHGWILVTLVFITLFTL